ncbi:hypothetical protein [Sphingomonas abietis]|uniref:Uncharacterized protein n=1 Tax=Sphingomonas abietis TaxID=3012344 RepID=A0ABY7NHA2_9SPHN|nr:hypothetical protein [Sphingomonas abietis]WBO20869.1 hypothetical protein PBT88_11665 [Sphingomonas abietis]
MADLPVSWMYLLFVGGFAICGVQALLRGDAPWTLALGIAVLLSAERAGISPAIVAWGIAGWLFCAAFLLLVLLARIWDIRFLSALSLIVGAALLTVPASARSRLADASLHAPPATAVAFESILRTMVGFR